MKVLVSGGSGYVGGFIVESTVAEGHTVVNAGRTAHEPNAFSAPVDFRAMTLDPDRDQSALFDGVDIFVHGAFQHVAGRYRGGEGADPEGFRQANLDGTVRLFREARAKGVKRILFLSSRAVYGTQDPGTALTETTPCNPDTLYGTVKLQAEAALQAMCADGFKGISLRVTGVYGQRQPGSPHKWETLIFDYLAGKAVAARVGTEVHGMDVGQAVAIVMRLAQPEPVYNVSDVLVDTRDILAEVNRLTGCIHPLPDTGDKQAYNPMDTSSLAATGWTPGGENLLWKAIRDMIASPNG
ncbi:NAD(P)-dependent oxidoreductase [Rhizobium sp. CFBP 8762]|uniref:NAD-dependent epimerase/dehydratase family protein n=1 Tax=Rhizobium sp. CFBP 8762 TaxID=2775279 RepID=UPI00177BB618|nr:NAD(P)-dependent oxidoreductase [Rhizobium sp. CFBP 8762]MBD8556667.1 NAD(P)-dependent oxidoreductase [Rhizobium sp. CFBP 8762]